MKKNIQSYIDNAHECISNNNPLLAYAWIVTALEQEGSSLAAWKEYWIMISKNHSSNSICYQLTITISRWLLKINLSQKLHTRLLCWAFKKRGPEKFKWSLLAEYAQIYSAWDLALWALESHYDQLSTVQYRLLIDIYCHFKMHDSLIKLGEYLIEKKQLLDLGSYCLEKGCMQTIMHR